MGVEVEPDGEHVIAERSRGTPRVRQPAAEAGARDVAEVRGEGVVTGPMAADALEMLEVDSAGLDRHDRMLLSTIATKFSGGPVGLRRSRRRSTRRATRSRTCSSPTCSSRG